MNKKGIISGLIIILIVFSAVYFNFFRKNINQNNNQTATTTENNITKGVQYKNKEFGFTFSLPDSWKGYSIVNDEWDGYSISNDIAQNQITETGPLLFIRHPQWTEDNQRQDIPIMVFTLSEWDRLQNDDFHIGAAPIGPNEIGRNKKYVFAIPARYNFSYLIGFEEVEQIIQGNNFSAQ